MGQGMLHRPPGLSSFSQVADFYRRGKTSNRRTDASNPTGLRSVFWFLGGRGQPLSITLSLQLLENDREGFDIGRLRSVTARGDRSC